MGATERKRAPLWLLPQESEPLPAVRKQWPRLAIAINLMLIAAAVPMFLYVLPESHWQPQALATLLICLGMLGMAVSYRVRANILVDPMAQVAFIATLLLGPLVGLAVLLAGEGICAVQRYARHNTLITATTNIASECWLCLTFALVLWAAGFEANDRIASMGIVLLAIGAGVAACATNNLIVAISCKTWDGDPFRHAILLEGARATLVDIGLIPCAVFLALLYQEIGLVALLPLAGLIFVPRALTWRIFRSRPIDELSRPEATRAYALTIADFLELGARAKTVLASAAGQLERGNAGFERLEDFQQVMQAVLYAHERWDGGEGSFPGVLNGQGIPIESRVLAVAHAWSSLTARDTRELEPKLALAELRTRAGSQFDPRVVAAAAQAVEQGLVPVDRSKPIRLRPEPALRAS